MCNLLCNCGPVPMCTFNWLTALSLSGEVTICFLRSSVRWEDLSSPLSRMAYKIITSTLHILLVTALLNTSNRAIAQMLYFYTEKTPHLLLCFFLQLFLYILKMLSKCNLRWKYTGYWEALGKHASIIVIRSERRSHHILQLGVYNYVCSTTHNKHT